MAEVFHLMTELGDELFNHDESRTLRGSENTAQLFGNQHRNSRFANQIHPLSRIEALTISRTRQLKVHIDVNNNETLEGLADNYNYVLCCFDHSLDTDGKPTREARLGYSRRSVGDFDRRELTCRSLIDNVIRPWVHCN
jgi:hypothetical protein